MAFRREPQWLDTAEPGITHRLTSDAQRLIALLRAYWLLPILLLAVATRFYDLTAAPSGAMKPPACCPPPCATARKCACMRCWECGCSATLALVYWVRQPRRRRYLVYYTLLMSAAFYTHYFTALCVLAHWLYLLLLRLQATLQSRAINRSGWWLANAAIVMLFAPWLPGLVDLLQHIDQLKASGDVGWEPSVDLSSLPSMVWQLLIQGDGETRSPLLFASLPLLVLGVGGNAG